jgi:hypothetical protein
VTARAAAAAMILASLLLYFGAAVPMRARAAATLDEFGRARVRRHDAMARAASLERRNQARARAVAAVKGAAADPEAATRAVRRSVAQVLERSRAGGVHLAIRPGAGGVDVTVSAHGPAADVLQLTGALARPDVGVVLERVQMSRTPGEVTLQVQGAGVAGSP